MSSRKETVIRSLRKRAASLGVDVSGLTDEELEARIVENSKKVAHTVAVGVRSTAKQAMSRAAELGRALSDPNHKSDGS